MVALEEAVLNGDGPKLSMDSTAMAGSAVKKTAALDQGVCIRPIHKHRPAKRIVCGSQAPLERAVGDGGGAVFDPDAAAAIRHAVQDGKPCTRQRDGQVWSCISSAGSPAGCYSWPEAQQ